MNSYGTEKTISLNGKTYSYHSLPELQKKIGIDLYKMPFSHRILLENLLRYEDGEAVTKNDIDALLKYDLKTESNHELQFTPGRVLLQDFTGVPVVADLGAMRSAVMSKGGKADQINPLQPVDLVIDHSVQVDFYADKDALAKNVELEFSRNKERYEFLKWGQQAFKNFQVVPPNTGICHQVNLEFLAHVAMTQNRSGKEWVYPDTLVGTDSHTTMINGLGVMGWGVGGIEAEAAMLGQPCTMLIPQVIGFELKGCLPAGATATDMVLTVTQMLRKRGVVGKFVEFFGEGVKNLSIADRATIGNMAPEYGATVGIFPVDEKTIAYLRNTGREERAARAEQYYKEQGLWYDLKNPTPNYTDTLTLDLNSIEACLAGPSKPHDRVLLKGVRNSFRHFTLERYKDKLTAMHQDQLEKWVQNTEALKETPKEFGILAEKVKVEDPKGNKYELEQGAVVIAAITSCTNTSNPNLMLGAAMLARNARKRGLKVKPWVKTSFAPGSKVVADYVTNAGLMEDMNAMGFNLVGFGCTTCIGNSGPLPPHVQAAIEKGGLATSSVISGNRNFEARIHPNVLANYLASPPLVVAYALAGNVNMNLATEPLGMGSDGKPVFLKEIWPDTHELEALVTQFVTEKLFKKSYDHVFKGDTHWQNTKAPEGQTYDWNRPSTYIQRPPFLDANLTEGVNDHDISGARILALFGDFITTDHISPAGNIGKMTPAGQYLQTQGVQPVDFNSYGARRGNHEVMMRGTFANVRIKNRMVEKEGGLTRVYPGGTETTIYNASEQYSKNNTPLIIFAGKEYGSGSSRDWAAKGTRLLGVRAVIAESFERIHRSNLVGMGVLPLQLMDGVKADSLGLMGDEEIEIKGVGKLKPKDIVEILIKKDGQVQKLAAKVRIDTPNELKYFYSGGILPFVLNRLTN